MDNTNAALHMATAHSLEPDTEEYTVALDRLMRRIPEAHADALQVGFFASTVCQTTIYNTTQSTCNATEFITN